MPDGDVLVFAGDMMTDGFNSWEVIDFAVWFNEQPHKHKIFIAGNHDRMAQYDKKLFLSYFKDRGCTYLEDSGCEIDGFKFWGSPWQPEFFNWAFNLPRGNALKEKWDLIPTDTDVLVTHGPPFGYCDKSIPSHPHLGCEELELALHKVQPRVHIFGHIHGGRGVEFWPDYENPITPCHNVSICDEAYRPKYNPHIIDIEPRGDNNVAVQEEK